MLEWLKRRSGRTALALIVMLIAAGLAVSFPPDIAFLFAIDMGTWVEAVLAVYVAAQVTRIRPLLTFFRGRFSGWRLRSGRQSRARSITRREPQSNDDDPAPAPTRSLNFDFRRRAPHLGFMTSETFRRFTVHAGQIPARA